MCLANVWAGSIQTSMQQPILLSVPQGQLERVEELRVELLCRDDVVHEAVRELKKAHPYECPAYDVVKLEEI